MGKFLFVDCDLRMSLKLNYIKLWGNFGNSNPSMKLALHYSSHAKISVITVSLFLFKNFEY